MNNNAVCSTAPIRRVCYTYTIFFLTEIHFCKEGLHNFAQMPDKVKPLSCSFCELTASGGDPRPTICQMREQRKCTLSLRQEFPAGIICFRVTAPGCNLFCFRVTADGWNSSATVKTGGDVHSV